MRDDRGQIRCNCSETFLSAPAWLETELANGFTIFETNDHQPMIRLSSADSQELHKSILHK